MAYANRLQPSKLSGSGNDTVNVSALSNNTGRNARSTNLTFGAVGVEDVIRTVNQTGNLSLALSIHLRQQPQRQVRHSLRLEQVTHPN